MNYRKYIKPIQNFPKEGVTFFDITPLLLDKEAFGNMCDEIENKICNLVPNTNVIVSPEARGFIFGSAVANDYHTGFFMLRKNGKLPNDRTQTAFTAGKEYGMSEFVVNQSDLAAMKKSGVKDIVIVDDILATGQTILSIAEFFREYGFNVNLVVTAIELTKLNGREMLEKAGYKVESIVTY